MAQHKELESGLKAMADEFRLPFGGRMELSKLVAGHLDWFEAAERRGLKWPDMIRALAAAGINGRNGKPLSVGTLSSTVWRKRGEAREPKGARNQEGLAPVHIQRSGHPPKSTKGRGIDQTQQGRRKASPQNDDGAPVDRAASKRSAGGDRLGRANKDVLAFMNRARAVRRRPQDD